MGVRVLTLVKNLPVLGVGEEDYKTEEACINANAGTSENPCVLS
jgi:hypothetical protein